MKRFVKIDEFVEIKKIKKWRVYQMTMSGMLPLRHINGQVLKPYEIDLEAYESLESSSTPAKQERSLKIEHLQALRGRRKESLWQK